MNLTSAGTLGILILVLGLTTSPPPAAGFFAWFKFPVLTVAFLCPNTFQSSHPLTANHLTNMQIPQDVWTAIISFIMAVVGWIARGKHNGSNNKPAPPPPPLK
jgi:hypothetical protein